VSRIKIIRYLNREIKYPTIYSFIDIYIDNSSGTKDSGSKWNRMSHRTRQYYEYLRAEFRNKSYRK